MTETEMLLQQEKFKRNKLKKKALFFGISASLAMGALGITLGATFSKNKVPSELEEFLKVYESLQGLFYEEVDTRTIIDGLYNGLTEAFNDDYTFYTSTYKGESQNLSIAGFGLGISRVVYYGNCLVKHVFAQSPAANGGLEDGDIIYAVQQSEMVDGNLVYGEKQVLKEIDSNDWSSLFQGEKDSVIRCYVLRDGVEKTFDIKRGEYVQDSVYLKKVTSTEGKVEAYITIPTFLGNVSTGDYLDSILNNIYKTYGSLDHLVIDLRQNGGGYVSNCVDALGVFLPKGSLALTYVKQGGKVENKYTTRTKQYKVTNNNIDLLIDDNTASAAESFVMGLVDSPCMEGVEVYGKRSFGKGIAQDFINVEKDTGTIRVTFAKVASPKNNSIHRIGIEPDIECGYVSKYEDVYRHYLTGGDNGSYTQNKDLVVKKINAILKTTYTNFDDAVRAYQTYKKIPSTGIFDVNTADSLQDDLYTVFAKGTNEEYFADYNLLVSYVAGTDDMDSITPLQRRIVKKQINMVLSSSYTSFDKAVYAFQEMYDLSGKSGEFDNETAYYLSGKVYDEYIKYATEVVDRTK